MMHDEAKKRAKLGRPLLLLVSAAEAGDRALTYKILQVALPYPIHHATTTATTGLKVIGVTPGKCRLLVFLC